MSPAYYAENGYRYYGKKELLNLQQILFFRELGFKLSDIKTIVTQNEFDRVKSLQKHKIYLLEKIQEFKTLRGHYWAKRLETLGFIVKLMSPRKVKKFVENHKNDQKDAQACAIAVTRSDMTFVPIKTQSQLDIQASHRVRSYYIKQRTDLTNMVRGLLLELGIAIPQGKAAFVRNLHSLLENTDNRLTEPEKELMKIQYDQFNELNNLINHHTKSLERLAQEDELAQLISTIPGVGPISATAIIAKIGNGSEFKQGRELSAYLGLVPKQDSSGEKQVLRGISKHGDRYIRQLLVHGGRACIVAAMRKNKITGFFEKQDEHYCWIRSLLERIGVNKTCVAVANKNARIILALLKHNTTFQAALAHETH